MYFHTLGRTDNCNLEISAAREGRRKKRQTTANRRRGLRRPTDRRAGGDADGGGGRRALSGGGVDQLFSGCARSLCVQCSGGENVSLPAVSLSLSQRRLK